MPYVDFTKPYWEGELLDGAAIDVKNYFVYSDVNVYSYSCTPCVIFNKIVADNYQRSNLYTTVEDGKWAMGLMPEYVQLVTHDSDADGKITQNDTL